TISFTIPIGMGMLKTDRSTDFARGILFGLIALPAALLVGGLLCGLGFIETLCQSLPALLLSALVLLGIWKRTALMIRGFSIFARIISTLATLGLMLGAFQYMTGIALIPGLVPIEEAMAVVASIGIVMLGSLPMAELMQRALRRPIAWFTGKTGMNSASAAGLLIAAVSVLPAIALVKDMDRRGRIVNAAFMVCAASAFAAQLGFTAGVDGSMILPLLASKLTGGAVGIIIALWATRK
ncbi:MAG: ethanolamine utilization protein EutH, partial [Phascolarctobacterium sp.]|nr:ethanolamine utilization protein EutH [Phascolarctobacterium sp.]